MENGALGPLFSMSLGHLIVTQLCLILFGYHLQTCSYGFFFVLIVLCVFFFSVWIFEEVRAFPSNNPG